MDFRISFTLEASGQSDQIVNYLKVNWSEKIAKEFLVKINSKLNFIKEFPFLYHLTEYRAGVRKCVVAKQVSLYYEIKKDSIIILSVYDTRQSPENLKV
ncbi:MAG: type II toxin-antitoxin system RelE/ParE family toxin [Ignavibacteria bacterium]|nr:type II toxin-antitoxin system RelE/ParE family toxin [Ignavibacteria bacterium]